MRNIVFSLLLVTLLSFVALAQDAGQGTAKVKKAMAPAAPKSDTEIQTCLNDKFKTSTSIKNGSATVSGGAATLTGEASSGGAKGGATRSAKACGAKTVTNNITVPPKPKKA
ncbi:MAG TPA: BON domain-containing protein [Blastocatellia bacterium]|nr:BON domain-containing protein [Blastocatellia bacterium]